MKAYEEFKGCEIWDEGCFPDCAVSEEDMTFDINWGCMKIGVCGIRATLHLRNVELIEVCNWGERVL
jgi:hypothetical protein